MIDNYIFFLTLLNKILLFDPILAYLVVLGAFECGLGRVDVCFVDIFGGIRVAMCFSRLKCIFRNKLIHETTNV